MKFYARLGRYTHEKGLLENYPTYIDGCVVPANIIAHYANSFRTIVQLYKLKYFIDPQTYVFQMNSGVLNRIKIYGDGREESILKISYRKLLDSYEDSEYLKETLKCAELDTSYFESDKKIKSFTDSTLKFQENVLVTKKNTQQENKGQGLQRDLEKYLNIMGEDLPSKDSEDIEPEFLLSPYFYFESTERKWYSINKKLHDVSKNYDTSLKKFAVLCFPEDLMNNEEEVDKLIDDFRGFDGYTLFISGRGDYTTEDTLKNYVKFIKKLKQKYNKPIINLYGTFFSAILEQFGLSGFSSGISITDSKDVEKLGITGRAQINYYVPSLKWKLKELDTIAFFNKHDKSENPECDCEFCTFIRERLPNDPRKRRLVLNTLFEKTKDGPSLRGKLLKMSLIHFLFNRKKEIEFVNESNIDKKISLLQENIIKSNEYSDISSNWHLKRWLNSLSYHA